MKRALIGGSFDPVTVGHINLIERAAAVFDEVYVVVLDNSAKKTMFSSAQRLELLRAVCAPFPNVRTDLSHALAADYMLQHEIGWLVKGARNGQDYEYEANLAEINREIGGAETVIFPALPELRFISSTFVREMIRYGRDIAPYTGDAAPLIARMTGGGQDEKIQFGKV